MLNLYFHQINITIQSESSDIGLEPDPQHPPRVELRQTIELDPKKPQFLQNVPKLGYRLMTEATE